MFKKCRLLNSSLRKMEYDYNLSVGSVDMQIRTGTNVKVPIGDLNKPCLLEYMIEIASEANFNLKCVSLFQFKVDGDNDYDVEDLRKYVAENGTPIAYKKMADIVKTTIGYSNSNPFNMPTYQEIMKGQN
ncbi:hypothetical protein MmiEs2_00510 [Methanimicrococcus stummii]|uniref:Uncharacterized protein n=1 Tax=Methanimicrococcus stummii TaxID=3028294 RepID=A0AA96ZWK4_9EURY|nr:hypothetical protein [Methanimicrococcus sp. Es2]WNY27874.1 hypothetical protein MmiEs2_00510 [Methanimicrococcus sp. Es2]